MLDVCDHQRQGDHHIGLNVTWFAFSDELQIILKSMRFVEVLCNDLMNIWSLGIFVNLHKLFCDKSVLSVCVDAGLHKILVRYANPVLVVDAVDECLSKVSVVEERFEWEIIFSSFDGCKSTLNDWKNSSSSVIRRC